MTLIRVFSLFVLFLVCLWQVMSAFYVVRPSELAVVSRFGVVDRVAQVGLQTRLPIIERVHFYPIRERSLALEGPFEVSGCPADVELIYLIDDVVAFHEAGADFGAIEALAPQVADILSMVPEDSEAPGPEARRLLSDALSAERPSGLRVLMTAVDLGDCGPQPPRIELRREELPALETVGVTGEERVRVDPFTAYLSDRSGIEVRGLVVTYDVIDPELVDECFWSPDMVGQLISNRAVSRLITLIWSQSAETLSEIAGRLPDEMRTMSPDYRNECGIEIGAVDYGATVFTRLIPINCDEAPDAPECAAGGADEP